MLPRGTAPTTCRGKLGKIQEAYRILFLLFVLMEMESNLEKRGPLYGKISDLPNQKLDIQELWANLQGQIDSLKSLYEKREQNYVTTTSELRDRYDSIICEASETASNIIVAATEQANEALESMKPEKDAWIA